LGFFCAARPGATARQQAAIANPVTGTFRVRVACNGAWVWAGIMGWTFVQRRSGRFRKD
jgi:hypothetical protein